MGRLRSITGKCVFAGTYEHCGSRVKENVASAKTAVAIAKASAKMRERNEPNIHVVRNTGSEN